MKILGIDTSADDTCAALVDDSRCISSVRSSQISTHKQWGGIMPVAAKLEHEKKIDRVVELAVSRGKRFGVTSVDDVDAIAVTVGPGLAIALEVGLTKAKQLAALYKKPLIAVNHMEGHLYSSFVANSAGSPERSIVFPFLSFLISGGHTQIVLARANGEYEILGKTLDDAAGEALDKAARMFGLGYPGGAALERLSREVENIDKFKFPRPMWRAESLDMSFSGLKTHVYYLLNGDKDIKVNVGTDLKDLASSFQEAVFDVLVKRLETAMDTTGIRRIACGGGVVANQRLRSRFRHAVRKADGQIFFPAYSYLCGDNAAMIAFAGVMMAKRDAFAQDIVSVHRQPRLSL